MGENLLLNTDTGGVGPCPCCAFYLSDSLFLPTTSEDTLGSTQGKELELGQDKEDHLSSLLSPQDALQQVASEHREQGNVERVILVDTHGHAHLNLQSQDIYSRASSPEEDHTDNKLGVMSLSCAVEEADWIRAVEYASRSNEIIFGLGVHPWYLENLSNTWLQDLEMLLNQHPNAIVGEIGLCKMARFVRRHPDGKAAALRLQRQVFMDQMRLAAKLRRPVSVHCVKQHGVFMSVLQDLAKESTPQEGTSPFPPAIGMHSFTGAAHNVEEILKFEEEWHQFDNDHVAATGKKLFYFGFSHSVNVAMCTSDKSRRQGVAAIRAVPLDRLMVESDVHSSQDVAAGTAGAVAYVASAIQEPLWKVARITAKNGLEFLQQTCTPNAL